MDDIDRRLIALLRTDARLPVSSLAAALDLSRATVRSRMDRLVAGGVIQGFTVRLNEPGSLRRVRAIMMVEVEGQGADRVMSRLHGFPEVRTLHSTNGRWDIVAELVTETLEEFDELLRRIRMIGGIAATETSILLSARKEAAV